MKYIGLVHPAAAGTKHAKVEIISAEEGAKLPDGTLLLEFSRAQDVIGCYITFDKFMHKGSKSAYVICSKFQKVDSPGQEEKLPEMQEEIVSESQSSPVDEKIKEPEAKTIIDSAIQLSAPEPPQPDVEKLQQQINSLRSNLVDKDVTIDKLKKKISKLEKKLSDQKEMDKLNLGGEQEFFPGEKIDFVLMAISEMLKKLEARCRRYDVLKGILDSNDYEKLIEKKRKDVEKILRNYDGLSGTMRKDLEKIGLFITENGAHYKIRYYGDSRYHVTMSKTPRKNCDIINDLKRMML